MLGKNQKLKIKNQNYNFKIKTCNFELYFLILILIFTFLIFQSFSPANAQEIPVNIKAQKLKYIEESGLVYAVGSVEVRLKEVTIYSDVLEMDPNTNIATAEGNVRLITNAYQAGSRFLIYDASSDVSSLYDFNTKVTGGRLKDYLYLSAKKVKDLKEKIEGETGELTSCGKEAPHYYVTADKFEYYPKDKIIGYNALMYVGQMPVLFVPYLVYDLAEQKKKNWMIGRNEVEGDYFKSAWDYPYGLFYVDLMEKKGVGLGTENGYQMQNFGLGTLYLYHLLEKDTGIDDWVTRIDHKILIDSDTTLRLNHGYSVSYLVPSGRRDNTTFGLNWSRTGNLRYNVGLNILDDRIANIEKYALHLDRAQEQIFTDYNLNYDFSKVSPYWLLTSQRLIHQQNLWSNKVRLSSRIDFINYIPDKGVRGDERLEPAIEITGQENDYSWVYRSNWYIDLDKDEYTGDNNYQYLEKLPELEIFLNAKDFKIFELKPSLGVGHYHEVKYLPAIGKNRDYQSERLRTSIDASKTVSFGPNSIFLGCGIEQYLYSPGDQRYAYREKLNLQTIYPIFKNEVFYEKGISDGNSPFLFDQIGASYHNIRERMTFYYQDKFNWLTESGYNWQTAKWFDIISNLSLAPCPAVRLNLRGGWDIENRRHKDLINHLVLVPATFFNFDFSTVSDLNNGQLKSSSVVYDLILLEKQPNQARVKLNQVYDASDQQFKVRDIMITKDLHCWEMKFAYSDYRREFSLTFSLKALPEEPVGFTSGGGFYYEGFDKGVRESMGGEDVRRY